MTIGLSDLYIGVCIEMGVNNSVRILAYPLHSYSCLCYGKNFNFSSVSERELTKMTGFYIADDLHSETKFV